MPTKIQQLLARDARQIIAQIGDTAERGGKTYDCVLSEPDVDVDLEEGGFMPTGDFTLKFLRADFQGGAGPFPGNNDRVIYDGSIYKITSCVNKKDSPYIKLSIAK